MTNINYEAIAEKTGWGIENVKKGYSPFLIGEGIEVIQKIDDLDDTPAQKFETDTEAGKQAEKDGYKLFTSNAEGLEGWYIIDTKENREIVNKLEKNKKK